MTHTVELRDEDLVDLILPDGRKISIAYSNLEPGDQLLPELDIMLPCDMAANCWTEHLMPAAAIDGLEHVRSVRQIIIPVEKGE